MAKRDGQPPAKGAVTLPPGGQVYVDPNIPAERLTGASAYAAGIMARRGSLPKADMPLSTPRPPLPSLDGKPDRGDPGGMTLGDYGRAERAATGYVPPTPSGPSIIAEAPAAPPPAAARHTPQSLGLAPNDLLPEEAAQDPEFRQGYGSQFACNQPDLAAKYGVIRGNQRIPPQRLGGKKGGKPGLRPETIKDLEDLRRLQQGPSPNSTPAEDEAEVRKSVAGGLGGSAARVGGVTEESAEQTDSEAEDARSKALRAAIAQMDAFQFNEWRQLTMRQILFSEEERELIESRLKPLDIGELLQAGVIRQRIPIIPGKYEITLQSYEGQVELALKRMVMMEARSVDVTEQYMLDKHSFMCLAVGLHKINDKVFPEIFDSDGVFSDKMFLEKFNMVMRLPLHMLASISVNLMWFEMRVRRLYSATAVGNG